MKRKWNEIKASLFIVMTRIRTKFQSRSLYSISDGYGVLCHVESFFLLSQEHLQYILLVFFPSCLNLYRFYSSLSIWCKKNKSSFHSWLISLEAHKNKFMSSQNNILYIPKSNQPNSIDLLHTQPILIIIYSSYSHSLQWCLNLSG